jgi:hypothetical protein
VAEESTSVIAHNLLANELMGDWKTLMNMAQSGASFDIEEMFTPMNDKVQWMVFKVKQRSQARYTDMTVSQISQTSRQKSLADAREFDKKEYPLNYNWPYDFVSIVESIKLDVEMKFDKSSPADLKTRTSKTTGKQNQTLNKKLRRKKALNLNQKQKKR